MFAYLSMGLLIIIFICLTNDIYAKKEIVFDSTVDESQKIINVSENSSNIIAVYNIPSAVTSLLIEAHSHVYNITLSETEESCLHCSITGRDVGMVYRLHTWESEAHIWLMNEIQKNISVLIVISYLDSYGPVPGGCNMEFSTEIAPYLRLRSNAGKIYLEYQHANIGFYRDEPDPVCSLSLPYITHDVYVSNLKENDFGEDEYFDKIRSMSNISLIKKISNKVMSYSLHPDTRLSFLMYPNVGVIYNIVAKYTVNGIIKESLYVPVSTYGCGSSEFTEQGCNFSFAVEGKVFLFLLSMYGFITAYFGHLFYGSTIFFFGFLSTFFIILILLGRFSDFSKSSILQLSVILGVLGGGLWFLLWFWLRTSQISLLLIGFVFGFLLAATILYSPIGNFEINLNDKNYWLLLATGSLLITASLLAYPTVLSILSSSVVGSYVMLLFYDDFISTRLAYIVLNIIKRAVSDNLEFATNNLPFQIKDAVICIAWIVLSVSAVIIQTRNLSSISNDINVCFSKSKRSNSMIANRRSNSNIDNSTEHESLLKNNSIFYNTFPK